MNFYLTNSNNFYRNIFSKFIKKILIFKKINNEKYNHMHTKISPKDSICRLKLVIINLDYIFDILLRFYMQTKISPSQLGLYI